MSSDALECPQCGDVLPYGAMACACGWNSRKSRPKPFERQRPIFPCTSSDCSTVASICLDTPEGKRNVCMACYDRYWQTRVDVERGEAGVRQPINPKETIARALELLSTGRRKPGLWWAHDIIHKHERGEKVPPSVLRIAREALANNKRTQEETQTITHKVTQTVIERVPGEDDE